MENPFSFDIPLTSLLCGSSKYAPFSNGIILLVKKNVDPLEDLPLLPSYLSNGPVRKKVEFFDENKHSAFLFKIYFSEKKNNYIAALQVHKGEFPIQNIKF